MKDRLSALIRSSGADAIYFTHLTNIRYLTGFTGSAAFLLVGRGFRLFFSDSRYALQARAQVDRSFETHTVRSYPEALKDAVKRLGLSSLAFEAPHVSVATHAVLKKQLRGIRLAPMRDDAVARWRMVKTPGELDILRKATAIAARSWKTAMEGFSRAEYRTERQLAARLEYLMLANGAEGHSFETIVASHANSALPHYRPGNRAIRRNAFLLTDYGVRYQGYCSDETITRVVGRASDRHRKIHALVLEAHDRALEAVRPGRTTGEIDAVARETITRAGYGAAFGHSTGHGVGLDIHEAPSVGPRTSTVLQPGMVITVEPGIYIEGWGGVRIEDMVVVTRDGCEVLTRIPKRLIAL